MILDGKRNEYRIVWGKREGKKKYASLEAAQAAIKEHAAWLEKMGYTVPEYEVRIV